MKCLVSDALQKAVKKRKSLAVIQRYFVMKYKILIGEDVIKGRLRSMQLSA